MNRADKILNLVVSLDPYQGIERRIKRAEYRDPARPKWRDLLLDIQNGVFQMVRFQHGYSTGAPTMLWEIAYADLGPVNPAWVYGIVATDRDMVRIWLGDRIGTDDKARRAALELSAP